MKSQLYIGTVMHRRQDRHAYRFTYTVFSLLLDLDELPRLGTQPRFFSHNRFNLFSLADRDHGPRDGTALKPWAERYLLLHGIDLEGGRIRLFCFPRLLGYVFNPLSVWYCEHRDGGLRAVICEVRNTFGEMHHYLLTAPDKGPMDWSTEYRTPKVFHVSPFIGPDMEYRFRLQEPGKWLRFHIDERHEGHEAYKASISAMQAPLTDGRLLMAALQIPLLPFKVMAAIHWHALKLWLKGAKFHRMPEHGIYADRVTKR
ncbi:MAG TPA: DUF1365 domain-containing protein [Gammaproteobacteria bacterium]|jgi:hypothetical protein